jgi:phage shock protein E
MPAGRGLSCRVCTAAVLAAAVLNVAACSSSSTAETEATAPAAQGAAQAVVQVQHLTPAAFAEAARQQGTILVDVRTTEEYAAGHIEGARNIDVEAADFAQRIAALDKSASYALYCKSGHRSGIAAQQMLAAGFTRVVDLAGGIAAWTNDGRQVVTG